MTFVEERYLFYLKDNDDVCMISGDLRITHRQLLAAVNRFAKLYQLTGAGGRVAVLAENRPEWCPAFFSAWLQKGVTVPIDAVAPVSDIAYIFKDCEPEAVFCTNTTLDAAQKALTESGISARIINVDELKNDWSDVSEVKPIPKHDPEDLALLVYTSGTTSAAKGCMITFHNLEINFKSMTEDVPVWIPNQTTLALLPFHHILPLQGCLLMPLHAENCKIVFCPSLSGPDIVKAIHDNQVTVFIAVPRVFQMFRDSILKKIHANPIASLMFVISKAVGNLRFSRFLFKSVQNAFGGKIRYFPTGGAALDYNVYYDLCALGFEVLPGSGMSEAAPVVAFTRPGHPRENSAGQLCFTNEAKIAEDGEILLRGENLIRSYWRKPKETAEAFTPDGWFHTGDLGYVDDENFLFYTGRKKELIILSNGKNVPPLVIEERIMAMTNLIEEIAVVAAGDVLNAVILPNFKILADKKIVNISETIRQTVIAEYNLTAEPYMRILKCTFVKDPLPRTRLGKLQRHKLAEVISGSSEDLQKKAEPDPDTPEYRIICNYLKEEQHCEKVHPSDHFEIDLGIDSLAKVEMLVFLNETFDADWKEQIIVDHPTPGSLAEFLHEKHGGADIRTARIDWGHILEHESGQPLPTCSWTHYPMNLVSKLLQAVFFKVIPAGRENIPDGPCIFACNHQSYLDGLFIMGQMDRKVLTNTLCFAKKLHVDNAFLRYLAKRHNIIIVDLNNDLKGSLLKLGDVLHKGQKVMIFPEGTRTSDGKLGIFKNIFAILARELQVPVVPVVLDGAYEVLPRGKWLIRLFRKVKVTFLPGFVPDKTESYSDIAAKTAAMIEKELDR